MKRNYRIAEKDDTRKIAEFLATNGELLLPVVELIESSRMAVQELVDLLGRASIEAVLRLSAQGLAVEKHQGRKGGQTGWHGTQPGTVYLSDRKLRVNKPRLRKRGQENAPRWRFWPMRPYTAEKE